MSVWKVQDLVGATGGKIIQKGLRPLDGVLIDSRGEIKNKIFFALTGENFDGHNFVEEAADKGASAIVVEKEVALKNPETTLIQVDNVLKALQDFGSWHRSKWTGKMVGLTGSNGKTTTKEFIHTILSQKHPTLSTRGNLNNHIGVPLTLLELREEHKYSVVEMGMNHSGEIAQLVKLAQPNIVMVTNVGLGHVGNFKNIEGVAQAKEEIYENAPLKATRIYNLDNEYTAMMRARAPGDCKIMTFSSHARDVNVSLKEKLFTFEYIDLQGVIENDPGQVRVHVYGRQQVSNCMAAATAALACGLDAPLIWKGLEKCKGSWGRGQLVELASGAKVLFDAYNSNPASATLALENFSKIKTHGKKYLVIGDMLELGTESPRHHFELGLAMAKVNPDGVYLQGSMAGEVERGLKEGGFNKNIVKSNTYQEKLAVDFGAMLDNHDMVLVKGSRGMKLEKLVVHWQPQNFEIKYN